ncbi:hypothetical protein [Amphibiibacter pelophylacis]|uniref:Uncharacterized protein n=1 Tax=Amphibiibacter pelophylacis TaxID=1799477 RepID=A0ACC6P2X2_9BURK
MPSDAQKWQDFWHFDEVQGHSVHDSGLRVMLDDGVGVAVNPAEIEAALTPRHGAHNAAAMVARLTREGAQILIDPYARGWRSTARPQTS